MATTLVHKQVGALSQAVEILSRPLGCGYKACKHVIYGVDAFEPHPRKILASGLTAHQEFEAMIYKHIEVAGHKQYRLRYVDNDEYLAWLNNNQIEGVCHE